MAVADATASGMPYPVAAVAGQLPRYLDQFVGTVSFTITKGSVMSVVLGEGNIDEFGVRLHEKDAGDDGKDVRVWQIRQLSDGTFTAETLSAF